MEEKEDGGDEEKDERCDERCHWSNNRRVMVLCVCVYIYRNVMVYGVCRSTI